MHPAAEVGGDHAADQGDGQGEKVQDRESRKLLERRHAAAGRSRWPRRRRSSQQALLRGLPLRVHADHLGVVLEREVDRLQAAPRRRARPHPRSRPSTLAPTSMRRTTVLVLDGVRRRSRSSPWRRRRDRHVARRRVDRAALRMSSTLCAGCRDAPDLDVVGLAGRGRCRRPPRRP